MITYTIFYNEEEGWVHTLASEVDEESGSHKVVDSTSHSPGGDLLQYAIRYYQDSGVSQDRVHIFRADRVILP
jgi:hypothetical protein